MKNRIFFLPVSIAAFLAITAFVPSGKKIFSFVKESRPVQEGKNYYIIIDKSDYELKVYDDEGWYATYPIVFGSKDLGDKMREGDKRTPNGHFKIIQKRINPKWGPQMLLDYPTAESFKKF